MQSIFILSAKCRYVLRQIYASGMCIQTKLNVWGETFFALIYRSREENTSPIFSGISRFAELSYGVGELFMSTSLFPL